MHFVYLLRVESRVEVSPASSGWDWLENEVYPGEEGGRRDSRSSFLKEDMGEGLIPHCLN